MTPVLVDWVSGGVSRERSVEREQCVERGREKRDECGEGRAREWVKERGE